MKLEFSRQTFDKYTNINFHENPSSGSWLLLADGQTGKTKQIVFFFFFCNFTNAPKYSNSAYECVDINVLPDVMESGRFAACFQSLFQAQHINALQCYNCKKLTVCYYFLMIEKCKK